MYIVVFGGKLLKSQLLNQNYCQILFKTNFSLHKVVRQQLIGEVDS